MLHEPLDCVALQEWWYGPPGSIEILRASLRGLRAPSEAYILDASTLSSWIFDIVGDGAASFLRRLWVFSRFLGPQAHFYYSFFLFLF